MKGVVERKIGLDEEASMILNSIAEVYRGNVSLAISELLRAHETIESFLDDLEGSRRTELEAQKERAEADSRPWKEVKRKNSL